MAAISLVLRLLGRDADPVKSREHVLLSVLAERRLVAGQPAELEALLADLVSLPCASIGALPLNDFLSKTQRKALAAALNALLASPSLASWRQGSRAQPSNAGGNVVAFPVLSGLHHHYQRVA